MPPTKAREPARQWHASAAPSQRPEVPPGHSRRQRDRQRGGTRLSKTIKLGVNLWTVYGWTLAQPIEEDVLRALADMGSQCVELVMDEEHNTSAALVARAGKLAAFTRDLGME